MVRIEFPMDTMRIQEICLMKGYALSLSESQDVWREYSDTLEAGWIDLPAVDENVWLCIKDIVNKNSQLSPDG